MCPFYSRTGCSTELWVANGPHCSPFFSDLRILVLERAPGQSCLATPSLQVNLRLHSLRKVRGCLTVNCLSLEEVDKYGAFQKTPAEGWISKQPSSGPTRLVTPVCENIGLLTFQVPEEESGFYLAIYNFHIAQRCSSDALAFAWRHAQGGKISCDVGRCILIGGHQVPNLPAATEAGKTQPEPLESTSLFRGGSCKIKGGKKITNCNSLVSMMLSSFTFLPSILSPVI